MYIEYRDRTPFERGWMPPQHYDPYKLFYDQPAYADYRAFEGFNFTSATYSFWDDTGRFDEVRNQIGHFGPLLDSLGTKVILSLGSGRPVWEVLISAQVPAIRIIASDINLPQNVDEDLRNGSAHGFPTASNISYVTLDIRDVAGASEIIRRHKVDTLFVCSCFFVTSDQAWSRFLSEARQRGVRNVILFHTEAISPLNIVRYRLLGANRTGVLMGYLRSAATVIRLFRDAGYPLRLSRVPLRHATGLRRLLARSRLHYAHRGYVFSTAAPGNQSRNSLRLAMND